MNKQFPSLYKFNDAEYEILNKGWNIIIKNDSDKLSKQFMQILSENDSNDIYKRYLCDIDINEHVFDLFFGILNKMVNDDEYKNNDDIMIATQTVLRMIGIRYAIKYKIIPNDYKLFKSCFDILFHQILSNENIKFQQYPQFVALLDKCWNIIICSIIIAFDF